MTRRVTLSVTVLGFCVNHWRFIAIKNVVEIPITVLLHIVGFRDVSRVVVLRSTLESICGRWPVDFLSVAKFLICRLVFSLIPATLGPFTESTIRREIDHPQDVVCRWWWFCGYRCEIFCESPESESRPRYLFPIWHFHHHIFSLICHKNDSLWAPLCFLVFYVRHRLC